MRTGLYSVCIKEWRQRIKWATRIFPCLSVHYGGSASSRWLILKDFDFRHLRKAGAPATGKANANVFLVACVWAVRSFGIYTERLRHFHCVCVGLRSV